MLTTQTVTMTDTHHIHLNNKNTMDQKFETTALKDLSLKLHYAELILEDVRDEPNISCPSEIYQDIQTLLNSETITPRMGFVIHPDGKKEPKVIIDDMADIQAAIGGYFELIEETDYWFVYADEDGRAKDLEKNHDASYCCRRTLISRYTLLGPVLFVFKNSQDRS